MKLSNHFKNLILGCLALFLVPLSFQLFASMHSQKEINSLLFTKRTQTKGQSFDILNSRNPDPTGSHWQLQEQVIHGRRSLMNMPTGTLRNWAKELSVNCCMPMLRLQQINKSRRLKTFLHKNLMH